MGDKDVWLGIDVAKGTFHAALACGEVSPRAWPKFAHAEFTHTELGMRRLLRWLGGQGVSPLGLGGVCVEATGRLGTRWRDMAGERVTPVSVVNPGCVHAFSRSMGLRDKTDRVDACVIALFGRVMRPRPTPAPVPEERALRELGRVHRALLCERLAWEQRLKDGPGTPLVRQMCAEMIRSIGGRLRRVERRMDEVVCSHSRLAGDYARLVGVKGIGRRTALSLLGEFGDLRQYKRGRPEQHADGRRNRQQSDGKAALYGKRFLFVRVRHSFLLLRFASGWVYCSRTGRGSQRGRRRRIYSRFYMGRCAFRLAIRV